MGPWIDFLMLYAPFYNIELWDGDMWLKYPKKLRKDTETMLAYSYVSGPYREYTPPVPSFIKHTDGNIYVISKFVYA